MIKILIIILFFFVFFFNDTATTEIYTLSLHDALPILLLAEEVDGPLVGQPLIHRHQQDRKSTRLNSSHMSISYAVFCLKKKKNADSVYCGRGDRDWRRKLRCCGGLVFDPITDLFMFFFFFNDTPTTEIYTLSLHDALPISCVRKASSCSRLRSPAACRARP